MGLIKVEMRQKSQFIYSFWNILSKIIYLYQFSKKQMFPLRNQIWLQKKKDFL